MLYVFEIYIELSNTINSLLNATYSTIFIFLFWLKKTYIKAINLIVSQLCFEDSLIRCVGNLILTNKYNRMVNLSNNIWE